MLIENYKNEILEKLEKSDFQFILTGSRFFNDHNVPVGTDWDFFAVSSDEIVAFLTELKFTLDEESYKDVPGSITVMSITHSGCKIDVQLLTNQDAKAKLRVQNIVRTQIPGFGFWPKKQRKDAWTAFLKLQES